MGKRICSPGKSSPRVGERALDKESGEGSVALPLSSVLLVSLRHDTKSQPLPSRHPAPDTILNTVLCPLLWWGAWVAQSVEHPTLAQVMISRLVSSSPTSGSVLTAQSLEPASDSVSSSLSAPPLLILSLSLSKINIKIFLRFYIFVALHICSYTVFLIYLNCLSVFSYST